MAQASGGDTWDIDWDYTKGLPENSGFTKSTSGTAGATLHESSGVVDFLRTYAKNNNSYVRYVYPQNNAKAVLEVSFTNYDGNNFNWIFSLSSDGTSGVCIICQYTTTYKGIYVYDNASISNSTKLASFDLAEHHVIRLEIENGYASIIDNGVTIGSNLDISTLFYGDITRVQFGANSSTQRYGALYYVKAKFG